MDLQATPHAAFSRRRLAQFFAAGAATSFYNEFAMAQEAERQTMRGREHGHGVRNNGKYV